MRIFCLILYIFISYFAAAQDISYYPKCDASCTVNHTYYRLCYSEADEQAKWVAYKLTAAQVNNKLCERTDDFRVDPNVKTGSATLDDYKGSGYDRGHLCPAADRHFSCDAMSETFFMSNMSPQSPSFNRGIWGKLESKVRDWAVLYNEVFVVTGPILNGQKLGAIGENQVTVPKYYFKTLLKNDGKAWTCIAMVLPNEAGNRQWGDYAITVDSLEKLTSVDFYPGLPDSVENVIEAQKNLSKWDLAGSSTGVNNSKSKNPETAPKTQNSDKPKSTGAVSKQCTAVTQKGTRCKRLTTSPNGKCWQHGGN
ncbi:MAG: DNA/RNA non-specific endonuclease [Bacteroidota bacterium]